MSGLVITVSPVPLMSTAEQMNEWMTREALLFLLSLPKGCTLRMGKESVSCLLMSP